MQVALTDNISSRALNSLAGATVNDRPHSSAYCLDYAGYRHRLSVKYRKGKAVHVTVH